MASLKDNIIVVKAEKIVFSGKSLCRCSDGIALFCEGLLPGETAEVLVTKDKKSFREGIIKNVLEKSLERVDALCSSFGKCGGCSFQNIEYQTQIKYKKIYVDELLSIFGVPIGNILESPLIWSYRNKMEFSFFDNNGATDLGLHCKGSFNKYISVPPCFISDKQFMKIAEIVKIFANKHKLTAYNNKTHEGFFRHLVLRKAQNNMQTLINIVTNFMDFNSNFFNELISELAPLTESLYWTQNSSKSDAVVAGKIQLLFGQKTITEKLTVCGKDYFFNISPFSFFQTNSKGTEILYNEIVKLLDPSSKETLLDLYCGTGSIGISISDKVKKVLGIEQVKQAVEDAKENAEFNHVKNAEFFAETAEDWSKKNRQKFDFIIIDPPRSGLTKSVIDFLLNSNAKKIIYVSCNPSTLARDLSTITSAQKYSITAITPVDMFPQTYHVETVVLIEDLNS
jgi:23S rRNA (uracil-5-)-methyltransferase RumA